MTTKYRTIRHASKDHTYRYHNREGHTWVIKMSKITSSSSHGLTPHSSALPISKSSQHLHVKSSSLYFSINPTSKGIVPNRTQYLETTYPEPKPSRSSPRVGIFIPPSTTSRLLHLAPCANRPKNSTAAPTRPGIGAKHALLDRTAGSSVTLSK